MYGASGAPLKEIFSNLSGCTFIVLSYTQIAFLKKIIVLIRLRSVLWMQFGMDWDVYLVKPDMTWKKISFRELLPMAFIPADLELERA